MAPMKKFANSSTGGIHMNDRISTTKKNENILKSRFVDFDDFL